MGLLATLRVLLATEPGARPRAPTHADAWRVIRQTMDELPGELRERLARVVISTVPRPTDGLQALGVAPGAKGAFLIEQREPYAEAEPTDPDEPSGSIFLFLDNIPPGELETVLWHEVGHALGLNEYEVEALGLAC